MSKASHIGLALLVSGLFCLRGAHAPSADPLPDDQLPDTIFTEILLTEDGVTAVDTAGYDWYYDFEHRLWVPGYLPDSERDDETAQRGTIAQDEIPIEQRCTEEKKVKPFEKSIWVGYEEFVDDDIIAYGRVTIKGWVKGDVKSISKRVLVTGSGRVDGDIEAPRVTVKEGGLVLGEINEVGSPLELEDITRSFSANGLIVVISFTIALLTFGFLTVSLMPRQMRNLGRCLRRHKVKSSLLGLLFLLLLAPILLVLAITIVGMVVIPLVPLIYLMAIGLGIVAFGNMLGRLVALRFFGRERSLLLQSMLGIALLMSLWFLVAALLGAGDDVSHGFGIFFLVVCILLTSFPIMAGVGASFLTRFGFREYVLPESPEGGRQNARIPEPAPPPIPEGPSFDNAPSKDR